MIEIHNGIKYDTGILNACAMLAGLSRDQGGVERLSETLSPQIDPYTLPEAQLPRGAPRASIDGNQAAVAAEFSCIALINPAGSNLIAVVDKITAVALSTNAFLILELTSEAVVRAALAGAETRGLYTDRRRNGVSARLSSLVGSEPTSIGGEVEQVEASGAGVTVPFVTSLPIILPPGQALVVRDGTVNLGMRANFGWSERFALPGELNVA